QNHVSAVIQGPDGYVWFATAEGLDRTDGYDIERFAVDPDGDQGTGGEEILDLAFDEAGKLWIGTRTGLDRYDPATGRFEHWTSDGPPGRRVPAGGIHVVCPTQDGSVWVGGVSLAEVDAVTGEVRVHPPVSAGGAGVRALQPRARGGLWVGLGPRASAEQGLFVYDPSESSWTRIELPTEQVDEQPGVTSLAKDAAGRLWAGTRGAGLFLLEGGVPRAVPIDGRSDGTVAHVATGAPGRLWVVHADHGAQDPAREVLEIGVDGTLHTRLGPRWGGGGYLETLVDRSGTLWAATSGAGVWLGDSVAGSFLRMRQERTQDQPWSLGADFVEAIETGPDGTIWVGHLRGLDRLDPDSGTVEHNWLQPIPTEGQLHGAAVRALAHDSAGGLWVATTEGGLFRRAPSHTRFDAYPNRDGEVGSPPPWRIASMLSSARGSLWLATERSPWRCTPEPLSCAEYAVDGSFRGVLTLYEDTSGQVWMGGRRGLARFDSERDALLPFAIDHPQGKEDAPTAVTAIAERPGEAGVLWLGTEGRGLARLTLNSREVSWFDLRTLGLDSNDVNGLMADEQGDLWVSTQRGFGRLRVPAMELDSFGPERGLQSLEFNGGAYHRGSDGTLYFGGVKGLNVIRPAEIIDNPLPPEVQLTGLRVSGSTGRGGPPATHWLTSGELERPVVLEHRQHDLTFEFVALHFAQSADNLYSYKLEGYDDAWSDPSPERAARYTRLPPGDYRFRVRAQSPYGVWSDGRSSMAFTITPAFWQKTWFWALALGGMLTGIGGAFAWRARRERLRRVEMEVEIARATSELQAAVSIVERQAERLGAIDAARSRFVADVSHEFRTPLALVHGPLEDLLDGELGAVSDEALTEVGIAMRNVRTLGRLVDRLLTAARLEAGQASLHLQRVDLTALFHERILELVPLAERRRVTIGSTLPDAPVWIGADAQAVADISDNLLTNAIKFSPAGATVHVALTREGSAGATLTFRDEGPGIAARDLPHIFERFYQGDIQIPDAPGTGIGLAVVRSLVELHGGKVNVDSTPGQGSVFTVWLPDQELERAEGPAALMAAEAGAAEVRGPQRPEEDLEDPRRIVLVVDDNADLRRLLRRQLQSDYRVVEAADGAEALRLAREVVPDVVVSDVVMPEMDGIALCRAIREDPELAFLPVVLLTARAQDSDRVAGLEVGADDYLVKPFDRDELRARVDNLVERGLRLRKALASKAQTEVAEPPPEEDFPGEDHAFIDALDRAIEAQLHDEGFDVQQLAEALHVSRVHLYRRLKALDQEPPNVQLIRRRVERGAELLRTTDENISQIAYAVGFKTVSHFSRRFKRQVGVSPSQFRSQQSGA
ncbi:MAG: response regulator, partial [Proteobacteria bacterium]|nr:response regulator [Pseudomonadota bacterium]